MALRIRFQYDTGNSLAVSIEQLSLGFFYDFKEQRFKEAPTVPLLDLPEDQGIFVGRYKLTIASTPNPPFADGDYVVSVHDKSKQNLVVAELAATMFNGDDATVFPVRYYKVTASPHIIP